MAGDLLDTLSEQPVPVPPEELARDVHHRLNPRLLILQLAEFALRAVPFAFYHFVRALAGAAVFTATGRFISEGEDDAS